MKLKIFVVSILLILIYIIITLNSSYAKTYAKTYTVTITKIVDGDTLYVKINNKHLKIRLLGIDTPEEYHSKKMIKDILLCNTSYAHMKKLGLMATQHAKTMLYEGERVQIHTAGKGYYGRTLAFIILPDGTNYNEKEIADGYACVYTYHGHKSSQLSWKEYHKLNQFMQSAKKERKGLWKDNYDIMEHLCSTN